MTEKDFDLFKGIARLSQPKLKLFLEKTLNLLDYKIKEEEDYIIAEGTIPIVLVAHLDTVFRSPPRDFYYDEKKEVLWSPQGLGADDRAGVYAILKLLGLGLRPHIIFCCEEETGGKGAEEVSKVRDRLGEVKYIIELDRRGKDDCVFYNCENEDFIDYIENFGFKEADGTFSDISLICPAWGIAGVNLSIGYRNEHSYTEYLCINEMEDTIRKVKIMLEMEDIPNFKYISFYQSYWRRVYHIDKDTDIVCSNCGKTYPGDMITPIHSKRIENIKYICQDCLKKENYKWCMFCGEPFKGDQSDVFCPICEKEYLENEGN